MNGDNIPRTREQVHEAILHIVQAKGLLDTPEKQADCGTNSETSALLDALARQLPGATLHQVRAVANKGGPGSDEGCVAVFCLHYQGALFGVQGLVSFEQLCSCMTPAAPLNPHCTFTDMVQLTTRAHRMERLNRRADHWLDEEWERQARAEQARVAQADDDAHQDAADNEGWPSGRSGDA